MRVTVLGAGSWGTTVAALVAPRNATVLWARSPETAERINTDHANPDYLPGFALPPELRATSDLSAAVSDADLLVVGVPTRGFRDVLEAARKDVRPWIPVVSLS
jgi:glycerol-3-phosphate dehydrogenase (NAD(P)+)